MYPKKFEDIILGFHKLPGVGMKTAERYAYALLDMDELDYKEFIKALESANSLNRCKECGNLSDEETCLICSDESRNHNLICVVQNPKDIQAIEKLGEYNGVYHVLNGAINTAKGILPEDINIQQLINRINENTEEVILALDPTVEGETTSLYISKLLDGKTNVSMLAHGIPMGSKLDYADSRTLSKALSGRIRKSDQS